MTSMLCGACLTGRHRLCTEEGCVCPTCHRRLRPFHLLMALLGAGAFVVAIVAAAYLLLSLAALVAVGELTTSNHAPLGGNDAVSRVEPRLVGSGSVLDADQRGGRLLSPDLE